MMVVTILSVLLFLIFAVLSGFHFYWLFGGDWGLSKVIPTKGNMDTVAPIPPLATLVVALSLLLFGLLYLIKSGLIPFQLPALVMDYGFWVVPSIFIIRAVGEFKYLGFFKKVKNTDFAKADSKIFSPLCLVIAVIGVCVQLLN